MGRLRDLLRRRAAIDSRPGASETLAPQPGSLHERREAADADRTGLRGPRENQSPDDRRCARRRRERRSTSWIRGKARVAEKIAGATGPNSWKVNQWLKKAVLLSFRLNDNADDRGRSGRRDLVGQDPVEIRRLGRERLPRGAGFRAVPAAIVRRSAFIAPGRRADAVASSTSAPMSMRSTMVDTWVDRRLLRPDRQERASLRRRRHRRRARAAAGQSDHHRGRLLHRRPLRSRRGRDRRRGRGDLHGRVHLRVDQDRRPRRPARCTSAMCRPIRWSSPARCRASRFPTARPAPRSIAR